MLDADVPVFAGAAVQQARHFIVDMRLERMDDQHIPVDVSQYVALSSYRKTIVDMRLDKMDDQNIPVDTSEYVALCSYRKMNV